MRIIDLVIKHKSASIKESLAKVVTKDNLKKIPEAIIDAQLSIRDYKNWSNIAGDKEQHVAKRILAGAGLGTSGYGLYTIANPNKPHKLQMNDVLWSFQGIPYYGVYRAGKDILGE